MVKRCITVTAAALALAMFAVWQIAGAAPGDVTALPGGAFTTISTPTGKIKATSPKTTVNITGSGGIVVTGASKTVNIDGSGLVPSWNNVTGKPSTFPPDAHNQSATTITGLATVATSGSYTDLSSKPTIPAAQVNSDWNASAGVAAILNKPSTFPPDAHNQAATSITGLATVATSGSYTDLSSKPTIPAAQVNTDWNASNGVAALLNKPAETCTGRIAYDGLDGSVIYTGSGAPLSSLGVKTDVYLDTLTGDFYRKDTGSAWTLKGNIKGNPGANGSNGTNGTNGTAATVEVGTVTALAYGSAPYVNNVGTSLAAILNFGVVTGQTGSAGSPDTQAQILAKIATPTDGAKVISQQGATEAGTVSKIEVRDTGGNLVNYISGNGTITVRKGGNTTWVYDTVTQSMTMYRGNGSTVAYKTYSTGKTFANGVWIGGGP